MSMFQLRTAMVKGETGTMSLDVRTSLDKGVSTFVFVCVYPFVFLIFLSTSYIVSLSLTEESDIHEE